jgi:hypothetical protein
MVLVLLGAGLYWRAAVRTGGSRGRVHLVTALIVACGAVTLGLDLAGV